MNFVDCLFILSTILIILSTILLVWTKNIIHSCVYLLGTLVGVAGLFITLGADLVAAIQVLVYVGGVVILMLFAVMLTGGQGYMDNKKVFKHLVPVMGNKSSYTIGLFSILIIGFTVGRIIYNFVTQVMSLKSTPVLLGSIGKKSTLEDIGILLITDHVIPFEIVSVLLLGALVGAAIIARPSSQKPKEK